MPRNEVIGVGVSRKKTVAVFLAILVTAGAFGMTMALTEPPPNARPGSVVQLTANPSDHAGPAFSPDGEYIAFSSNQSGSHDIWVMREDGRQLAMLSSLPGDEIAPAWDPNGGRVAFLWEHGQYSDLCTASVANDLSTCLTDGSSVRSYSWSPDGLLTAYDEGNGTIGLHNMTSGANAAFPFDGYVSDPAFGPRSGVLYFSLRTVSGDYIWNASTNGQDGRQLSWEGSDIEPRVSPVGNYLMYLTNLSGRYEPWLIDLATGENAYLFNRPDLQGLGYTFPSPPLLASHTVPSWDSNGTGILFISGDKGSQGSLYLVTPGFKVDLSQSSNLRYVLALSVYSEVPFGFPVGDAQWSPSGNVVIQANVSGFAQLFLLRNGPAVKAGYGG